MAVSPPKLKPNTVHTNNRQMYDSWAWVDNMTAIVFVSHFQVFQMCVCVWGRGVLGRKLGGGVPLTLSNPDPIQETKL